MLHTHIQKYSRMKCDDLSLTFQQIQRVCSVLSAFSNWEREPGLSTVSTADILMLHQSTRLKWSFRMRFRKPYISSLLGGGGRQTPLYYSGEGLWQFASVAATCDRNQVESVPFLFTCVFLRAMWIKMCNDEKGFHEFCIKLSYCSFLSWMML